MLRSARSDHHDPEPAPPLEHLLPVVGAEVDLLLGEHRLAARVHGRHTGHIDLWLRAAPINVRRAADVAAQLHTSQDRGVCRLLGRLRMLSGDGGGGGVLVDFQYAATPQLLLRREHVRADLAAPIELDLRSGRVRTRTLNMSAGGLLVVGPLDVSVGELVNVAFRLPGGRAGVHALARVARIDAEGNVGLALVDISPADQARLTLAVFEERRRLSARR